MNPSKYAFQAGLFMLLSTAAAIFLIARVAESRGVHGEARRYVAVFPAGEDVGGLSEGAEVRLLGIKIGRVDKVTVEPPKRPEDDASIHVAFSIGAGVELRETGPRVELQTALTGGAWLNIQSVGTGKTMDDGAYVAGSTANLMAMIDDVRDEVNQTLAVLRGEIDTISDELVQTTDSIEGTADSATRLINKIETEIEPTLDNANSLITEATGVMAEVRGVFGDSGEDIRTTLANLNKISTTIDAELPETLDRITGLVGSIEAFVNSAESSLDNADKLLNELTGTTADARAMLASNRPSIDRAFDSARRGFDEFEGLVDDLRANPSRLIWPPDEKDLNNLDLYGSARSYAEAAEDLQSAADALREASLNENADPEKLRALQEDLMKQFEHFDKLQTEVWTRFEK